MEDFVIVGVDVSKATLDFFILPSGTGFCIANGQSGFKKLLMKLEHLDRSRLRIVMEHTGRYSLEFEAFLHHNSISYSKVPALDIKRSQGMTRGKSDRLDAKRIAEYGRRKQESLVDSRPLSDNVLALKDLLQLRSVLIKDRAAHLCRQKELAVFTTIMHDKITALEAEIVAYFNEKIKLIDKEIEILLDQDADMKQTVTLLKSIKGVGTIISAYMIIYTNNFKNFANARKFNCYIGVAPFDHQSGTSLRSRSRVSHLANKQLKTLLTLAAFSAIRADGELKEYYQRRVDEGKKKMDVINAVRSKIVARMFAVTRRQSPYHALPAAA
jgi:transposase